MRKNGWMMEQNRAEQTRTEQKHNRKPKEQHISITTIQKSWNKKRQLEVNSHIICTYLVCFSLYILLPFLYLKYEKCNLKYLFLYRQVYIQFSFENSKKYVSNTPYVVRFVFRTTTFLKNMLRYFWLALKLWLVVLVAQSKGKQIRQARMTLFCEGGASHLWE